MPLVWRKPIGERQIGKNDTAARLHNTAGFRKHLRPIGGIEQRLLAPPTVIDAGRAGQMMVIGKAKAHFIRNIRSPGIFGSFFKLRLSNVRGIDVHAVAARQMNGSGAGPTGYFKDPLTSGQIGSARHVVFRTLLCPGQRFVGFGEKAHVQISAPDR